MKKLTKQEHAQFSNLLARAIHNQQLPPADLAQTVTPVDAVKSILNQRGERYGDFTNHAQIAQDLQDVLRGKLTSIVEDGTAAELNVFASFGWRNLSKVQRQALTVICAKLARIISGDPNYDDNWIDIQGYARLVQERLPQSGTSPE